MKILLVGYGPVGARFVDEILPSVTAGLVELTVVGAEAADAYNRVLVAEYAVGRTEREAMDVASSAAAIAAGARVLTDARVLSIDRAARTAVLSTGESLAWDKLVLATGSRANVPTLSGVDKVARDRNSLIRAGSSVIAADQVLPEGITVLRDLVDADRVREVVDAKKRIVVLGAGVLGLEIALAAAREGAQVCVVHHGGFPMARNLDQGGGTVLAQSLKKAGVALIARSRAEGVVFHTAEDGTESFDALLCADGKTIHGDMLLLSCGVSPRVELATLAGLPTSAGILVDTDLSSWGDPNVFAIGDCAHVAPRPDLPYGEELPPGSIPAGSPSGLIGPGWRQADYLAARFVAEIAGANHSALAEERPALVMLKAEDIDVVSVGDIELDPWDTDYLASDEVEARQVSQWVDPQHGRYLKMVTRDGVLEGFVSVGLPRTAAELTLLFERASELPADRSVLLRNDGPDFVPSTAEFAPDATVCWCNGVTVGHIHTSFDEGNDTVSCIGKATRAGTGCGGCKGRIGELLEKLARDDAAEVSA